MVWLLAAVGQLLWIRRKTCKGSCSLCVGEEDVHHMLLECLGTRNWSVIFANAKWLNSE